MDWTHDFLNISSHLTNDWHDNISKVMWLLPLPSALFGLYIAPDTTSDASELEQAAVFDPMGCSGWNHKRCPKVWPFILKLKFIINLLKLK